MNNKKILETVDFFHQEAIARLNVDQFDIAMYCMRAQEAAFSASICIKQREKLIKIENKKLKKIK